MEFLTRNLIIFHLPEKIFSGSSLSKRSLRRKNKVSIVTAFYWTAIEWLFLGLFQKFARSQSKKKKATPLICTSATTHPYDGSVFCEWMAWAITICHFFSEIISGQPAMAHQFSLSITLAILQHANNQGPQLTGKSIDQCKNCWPAPKWTELKKKGRNVSEWTRFNFVSTCFFRPS